MKTIFVIFILLILVLTACQQTKLGEPQDCSKILISDCKPGCGQDESEYINGVCENPQEICCVPNK